MSSSARAEKVSGSRAASACPVAAGSSSSFAASERTAASGREPTTSGSTPDAAEAVTSWVNWFSSTPTISTVMPVACVNRSATDRIAASRSGRFSSVQTTRWFGSRGGGAQPAARTASSVSTAASGPAVRVVIDFFPPKCDRRLDRDPDSFEW